MLCTPGRGSSTDIGKLSTGACGQLTFIWAMCTRTVARSAAAHPAGMGVREAVSTGLSVVVASVCTDVAVDAKARSRARRGSR